MKKVITFHLLILFTLSCQINRADKSGIFPETIFCSAQQRDLDDSIHMRYPFKIRLEDSCLYIMDLHATEYYCHVYEYSSLKYKRSFGKKGEGPSELLDAENIRLDTNNQLWILDANKEKIFCFRPDSTDIFNQILLSKKLIRSLDFDMYNDSTYIIPDYTGKSRYHLVNHKGEIIASRGSIPIKEKISVPEMAIAQSWRSFLDYNPNNGILAMVTQLGEVLEIYNVQQDTVVKIVYGSKGVPQFNYSGGYSIPAGIMGYSDVYVSEKNIYVLFWGHSLEDIKKGITKVEGGNTIQVFDLAGNPVRQYILNRYITGFYLNEDDGILLGLDVNQDQPLVEFQIL